MAKINGKLRSGLSSWTPTLSEEATAAMVDKFKTLVETQDAPWPKSNEWGKRRLAYPINDLNEGYYVLMTFTSDARVPR